MSRAINVNASQVDVTALCKKHNVPFSAIEDLPSGGTRVVLLNANAVTTMNRAFGKRVISGYVARQSFRKSGR